jgi:multicomponent Na+:H+ antiporter subunit E
MRLLDSQNQTIQEGEGTDDMNGAHPSLPSRARRRFTPFLLTFFIMFVLWILLSGKFDAFHLSLGIISCSLVAYFSADLLFETPSIKVIRLPASWIRFVRYVPWLLYQIFLANLHVLYLTLHPRMMDLIDPRIIKFRSRLRGDLSRVAFANSITLTPGTITVYVSLDGNFSVHAIDQKSREGLPGEMEARIAKAFGEE